MSDPSVHRMPPGFRRGPLQGGQLIGEITEALHRWLLDGWPADAGRPPRIEEDLSFVPHDREEVVFVYMYRVARNDDLQHGRRWRPAPVPTPEGTVLYERPPLMMQAYYMVSVHSRFRSEAERLLGWVLLRLSEASHLIYRPRAYKLPSGGTVDSLGRPWAATPEDGGGGSPEMEKVSLALVEDLGLREAIDFFTIHEAPWRPYATFRAMCALRSELVDGPPTSIHPSFVAPTTASEPR